MRWVFIINRSCERNSCHYIRLRLSALNTNFLRLFTTREAITWRRELSRRRKEIERGKNLFFQWYKCLKFLLRPYPDYILGTRPSVYSQVIPSAKEVSPSTFLGERRSHPSLRIRVYEVLQHWLDMNAKHKRNSFYWIFYMTCVWEYYLLFHYKCSKLSLTSLSINLLMVSPRRPNPRICFSILFVVFEVWRYFLPNRPYPQE